MHDAAYIVFTAIPKNNKYVMYRHRASMCTTKLQKTICYAFKKTLQATK